MEEFYFRVVYWDEELTRTPKLVDSDNDVYGNFLHNCIVYAWLDDDDDLVTLNNFKKMFKERLKTYPDCVDTKLRLTIVNFIMNDMAGFCNKLKIEIFYYPVLSVYLLELLIYVVRGKITYSEAINKVLPHLINLCDRSPEEIIDDLGLGKTDTDEMGATIDRIINNNLNNLELYRGGKKGLFGMFMGEIMKTGKGFNPKLVNEVLRKKLDE